MSESVKVVFTSLLFVQVWPVLTIVTHARAHTHTVIETNKSISIDGYLADLPKI